MNIVHHIVMAGFTPFAIALFYYLKPHKAVAWALVIGHLFLPQGSYAVTGLPDVDRVVVASFGTLIAAMVLDSGGLATFRPRWFDFPMVLWLLWPLFSSVANGQGFYDGASALLTQLFRWGIPYFLGRVYFGTPAAADDLFRVLVVGVVIYIPLCLWEVRMSSQLHRQIYGFHGRGGSTAAAGLFGLPHARYRVFLDIALNAGVWMSLGALALFWCWITGQARRIAHMPIWLLTLAGALTAILARVLTGTVILGTGMAVLLATRIFKVRWFLLGLLLLLCLYLGVRATGVFSGDPLLKITDEFASDKTWSLRVRIENATLVVEKALEKPVFGWGSRSAGWRTRDVAAVDALWAIAIGKYGLVGVFALYASMLLPAFLFLCRKDWLRLDLRTGIIFSLLATQYMVHNLFNAMIAPPLVLIVGGLASLAAWTAPPAGADPSPGRPREEDVEEAEPRWVP